MNAAEAKPAGLAWDDAFIDRSGNTPVHLVATYTDGAGAAHRLEEWRVGRSHLRRRTDDRIDLHADAATTPRAGQPVDYVWQILDLQAKIEHRVSTRGMLRLGMLYSYYAMAHVLNRPPGSFDLRRVDALAPVTWNGAHGTWFEVDAAGRPATRICWLPAFGLPLRILSETGGAWKTTFELQRVDTRPIPAAVFAVQAEGFRVRDADENDED